MEIRGEKIERNNQENNKNSHVIHGLICVETWHGWFSGNSSKVLWMAKLNYQGFLFFSNSTITDSSFHRSSLWASSFKCWRPAVRIKELPGIDEILGQADVSRGPCDGDLALWRALHGVGNFDLRPRHLSNLIYFGSLTSNNATY